MKECDIVNSAREFVISKENRKICRLLDKWVSGRKSIDQIKFTREWNRISIKKDNPNEK